MFAKQITEDLTAEKRLQQGIRVLADPGTGMAADACNVTQKRQAARSRSHQSASAGSTMLGSTSTMPGTGCGVLTTAPCSFGDTPAQYLSRR